MWTMYNETIAFVHHADPEHHLDDDSKAKCLHYAVVRKNNGKALDVLLENDMWK